MPVIVAEQGLAHLQVKKRLGRGTFGTVDRVVFRGSDAVRKTLTRAGGQAMHMWEAQVTLEVAGAGGAPHLHAVSIYPPAFILDYAGIPYYRYYSENLSMREFLVSVVGVAKSLAEVHSKGFVHNDFKMDNITVSGPRCCPSFHVIDFGIATRIGCPFDFDFFGMKTCQSEDDAPIFRSPEWNRGEPLYASSDVFSLGVLLAWICHIKDNWALTHCLHPLLQGCLQRQPDRRPSLDVVVATINSLLTGMTLQWLEAPLDGREY